MSIRALFGVTMIGVVLAIPAMLPLTQKELRSRCFALSNPDPAKCTAVIESGREDAVGLSNAYRTRAAIYSVRGDVDRALKDLDEAIRLDPTNDGSFALRGNIYRREGRRLDHALQAYDEAIRLIPSNGRAYFRRALTHADMGHYERAFEDFEHAIRLMPEYTAQALYSRGVTRQRQGDMAGAAADIAAAKALQPGITERAVGFGDPRD